MHELSITCSIIDAVVEAAQGRKVSCVTLEIGKLSGVMPETIAFCFPEVACGTELETARIDICEIDGSARCSSCGMEFATPSLLTTCPCGSLQFQRLTGQELNIKSVELEEAL